MPRDTQSTNGLSGKRARLLICLLLAAATLAVYWRVLGHDFVVGHDDGIYVTQNPHAQEGLAWKSVRWAFSTGYASNWHPLTWLSHMFDCQLYGLNPTGHHITNLALHIANTLLLFLLLSRMTGLVWRSGFVAALFALHPLHVESAAWVAERKDVLSAFFCLLTIWAYVSYTKRPGVKHYLPVMLLFALGLMAKPMLVSLPFVLLLLDWWPLGRAGIAGRMNSRQRKHEVPLRGLAPLFVLAMASCVVTYLAQKAGGAVGSLGEFPLSVRAANAAVAYVGYIAKTIWPARLACLYPHPDTNLPTWQVVGSAILLTVATVAALWAGRRRPYIAVGWLWYVVMLVPVIGLVQVGSQAMADRYTYLPIVGLFIIAAWGAKDIDHAQSNRFLTIAALVVLLALSARAWLQVGYWRDTETLFKHALAVVPNNYLAENELAAYLWNEGRMDEAREHITEAVRIKPQMGAAHFNLAVMLYTKGDYTRAWEEIRLCRKYGWKPSAKFIRLLSGRMGSRKRPGSPRYQ